MLIKRKMKHDVKMKRWYVIIFLEIFRNSSLRDLQKDHLVRNLFLFLIKLFVQETKQVSVINESFDTNCSDNSHSYASFPLGTFRC